MNSTIDTLASVAKALDAVWELQLRPHDAPDRHPYAQELVDLVLALADQLDERDARHLVMQLRIYGDELRLQGKSTK